MGTQRCDAGIASISTDGAGNVYVLGVYDHSGTIGNYPLLILPGSYTHNDDAMYFLAKIGAAGNVLWARNIFATTAEEGLIESYTGADYFEEFYPYGGVAVDTAGNCYVAGVFIDSVVTIDGFTLHNPTTPPAYSVKMFVAKFNTSGTAMWASSYGGKGFMTPVAPVVSQQGDMYLAGRYSGDSTITLGPSTLIAPLGNPSIPGDFIGDFLMKIDNTGASQWAVAPDSSAFLNSVAVDTSGYVYITGQYGRDSINFGGHELVNYEQTSRHGDVFLVKYDGAGHSIWAVDGGGAISASASSVATDECGHVFIAGNLTTDSSGAIYFNGGGLYAPVPNSYPMFIASFDAAGNYLSGQSAPDGGWGGITPLSVAADNHGNLLVGGQWSSANFSFGPDHFTPDSGETFMFVAKLQYDSTGCLPYAGERVPPLPAPNADIALYPNPATTQLTISAPENITSITITNLLGQVVYSSKLAVGCLQASVDVAALPSGVYLVRVTGPSAGSEQVVVRKFVKD